MEGVIMFLSVFLLITIATVHCDWESDPEWSYQVYLNEQTLIKCNDSIVMLIQTDEIWWRLPNGDTIHGWSKRNTNKLELMADNGLQGGILKIKNVQMSDKGLYYCMVYRQGQFHLKINRGLNMYGYLERDNFEMYRENIIIGIIAAAVFVIPFLGICFIYHFRYMSADQQEKKQKRKEYFTNLHTIMEDGESYPTKPEIEGLDNHVYDNTQL